MWRVPSPIFALGARRGKAAFFSGCESHPATIAPAGSNRSSLGGNEVAEASGVLRIFASYCDRRTQVAHFT